MAKRTRKPLELWRSDMAAFAAHLGIDLAPYPHITGNIRTLESDAWRKALEPPCPRRIAFDEAARWKQAEELLWMAATRETDARRDEAIAAGKIREVRASIGMPWVQKKIVVMASIGMNWNTRVSDLFDHPAVRAAMPPELYAIIHDVLTLFLKERKELEELRAGPDPKRVKALAARADGEDMPDAAHGIVQRLAHFVKTTERQGESKAQRTRSRKGRKELPGDPPTSDDQAEAMRTLRRKYPADRPRAMKKFAAQFDVTERRARDVACGIGWKGRATGRPKGSKKRKPG